MLCVCAPPLSCALVHDWWLVGGTLLWMAVRCGGGGGGGGGVVVVVVVVVVAVVSLFFIFPISAVINLGETIVESHTSYGAVVPSGAFEMQRFCYRSFAEMNC